MNRLSVMLLSECREMFGIVLMPLDKWKELQAGIAQLEAAPERKCGTCIHIEKSPTLGQFCNHLPQGLDGDPFEVSADWFCADWQRKEGK